MMHHIKKSEVVPYSASEMFSLVADVARYNEFLPWCTEARVLHEKQGKVEVEFRLAYGPIRTGFTTRNRFQPNEKIEMQLLRGPLKHLEGSWSFRELPEGGTRISIDLKFQLAYRFSGVMLNPLFVAAAERMVSAFKERAAIIYSHRRHGH